MRSEVLPRLVVPKTTFRRDFSNCQNAGQKRDLMKVIKKMALLSLEKAFFVVSKKHSMRDPFGIPYRECEGLSLGSLGFPLRLVDNGFFQNATHGQDTRSCGSM